MTQFECHLHACHHTSVHDHKFIVGRVRSAISLFSRYFTASPPIPLVLNVLSSFRPNGSMPLPCQKHKSIAFRRGYHGRRSVLPDNERCPRESPIGSYSLTTSLTMAGVSSCFILAEPHFQTVQTWATDQCKHKGFLHNCRPILPPFY